MSNVPVAGETIAVVTSYPELVEAFRTVKARLGLSNKWCDDVCGYADGITDKKLGPSQTKSIDPLAFSMFCQIFAVKFTMQIDLDAARRMEEQWEGRVEGKVSVQKTRMSKLLIERAKPIVLKAHGKQMNAKRNSKLSSELRSKIARKAGKKRMRNITKAERSAMSLKGWQTRRRELSAAALIDATSGQSQPAAPSQVLSRLFCTTQTPIAVIPPPAVPPRAR